MITLIVSNFSLIVATVCVVILVGCEIKKFIVDRDGQIDAMKNWLLYAVTMAEKEFGSGTGQLKLRYVYDLFVSKFVWLAKIITFEEFSGYVDEALDSMKDMLENNERVARLIER